MDQKHAMAYTILSIIVIVCAGIRLLAKIDSNNNGDPLSYISPNEAVVTVVYESDHFLTCYCTLYMTEQEPVSKNIPSYGSVTMTYKFKWSGERTKEITAEMFAKGALGDQWDSKTIKISDKGTYQIHLKA